MRLPQIARQVRIELEFMVSMSSAAELMYKTQKELVLIRDFNQDMYMNFAENRLHDRNS